VLHKCKRKSILIYDLFVVKKKMIMIINYREKIGKKWQRKREREKEKKKTRDTTIIYIQFICIITKKFVSF